MSDNEVRSCSTCVYGNNQADCEPCATCIKYTEPWKPHWQDARSPGLLPEQKRVQRQLDAQCEGSAAPTTAQMRAMLDAVATGTGITQTRIEPKAIYKFAPVAEGYGATPEAMATGGVKFDADKPRMDLLDAYAIEQLSLVLAFGARKYDSHNWRKGIAKSRLIAAALRHLFAYLRGEDKDPETGLSHAAHAMCCCMFLLGLEHRVELDDRWKESA